MIMMKLIGPQEWPHLIGPEEWPHLDVEMSQISHTTVHHGRHIWDQTAPTNMETPLALGEK